MPELSPVEIKRARSLGAEAAAEHHRIVINVPLAGKRVAVIGTGASAIQIVPAIQPEVSRLFVLQRSPAWILPRPDFAVSATVAEVSARRHLRSQVRDERLREQLTPNYAMGCKRILLSNDFYPALCQPNTELVTTGLREVTPNAIVTEDGVHREVDVIVLCTGFQVADHPITRVIRARDGRTLAEHWEHESRAYLGMNVPGFPNLFLLGSGPHTGLGHNSIVYMIEAQIEYLLAALDEVRRRGGATLGCARRRRVHSPRRCNDGFARRSGARAAPRSTSTQRGRTSPSGRGSRSPTVAEPSGSSRPNTCSSRGVTP